MNEFYYYFNETRSSQGKKKLSHILYVQNKAREDAQFGVMPARIIFIYATYTKIQKHVWIIIITLYTVMMLRGKIILCNTRVLYIGKRKKIFMF